MDLHYIQGEPVFTKIQKNKKQYPYLDENKNTEIVIIGGGVTGSIVAYYMTKIGVPTVLIEAKRIAHGSTSVTTSLLQYELDYNARELEQYTSLQNVVASYKLGLEALGEIHQFIQEHGNRCQYSVRDTLLYTNKKQEISLIEGEYELRKEAGLDVSYIKEHEHEFSFDLRAGVYAHQGGAELNPYLYTHQLLEISTAQGLEVYENTEAIKINYLEEGVEVVTAYDYKIRAKKVILATGYNTDMFTNRVFGTKTVTYNIATKPVDTFEGWTNQVLIRDNQDPYHYFRTTPEGRILVGGEDVDFKQNIFDEKLATEKYEQLLERLKMMFPHISDLEIEYSYCGAFASTQDNLGFLGEDPKYKDLWYCLGYGANGILFAILGGMMLSKLYQGEKNPYLDLFKVERFDCTSQ